MESDGREARAMLQKLAGMEGSRQNELGTNPVWQQNHLYCEPVVLSKSRLLRVGFTISREPIPSR